MNYPNRARRREPTLVSDWMVIQQKHKEEHAVFLPYNTFFEEVYILNEHQYVEMLRFLTTKNGIGSMADYTPVTPKRALTPSDYIKHLQKYDADALWDMPRYIISHFNITFNSN